MIYTLVPIADTTIYEAYPSYNAGLNQVLDFRKTLYTGSTYYDSRILMKFDTNQISGALSSGSISYNSARYILNLKTVKMSEIPTQYNVVVAPISQSWTNGVARTYEDAQTIGACWSTRDGSNAWVTSSSGVTSSFSVTTGGGNWFTSSIVSQSFIFNQDNDLNIDVTNIVSQWMSGSLSNEGFILRMNPVNSYELSGSILAQFYSLETHTVYSPNLKIQWTGSISYTTGSNTPVTSSEFPVVYLRNYKNNLLPNVKVRVRVGARARYPRHTFSQNSDYLSVMALPSSSYYRILDAHTNEIINDFSEYTQLSCDSESNYFDFYTTNLYPERFYKFVFKSTYSDSVEFYDDNYIFKIVK